MGHAKVAGKHAQEAVDELKMAYKEKESCQKKTP